MSLCVVDSSVALAWVLPDEAGSSSTNLLQAAAASGIVVPSLWPIEVANALMVAQRRNRITGSERRSALASLSDLPLKVDAQPLGRVWTDVSALAESTGLTVYDACYLEVAARLRLPLATLDRALRAAAEAQGVGILE